MTEPQAHRQHQVEEAGAQGRDDAHGQQHLGNGHEEVHAAHDDVVQLGIVGGDDPQEAPGEDGDAHRQKADGQGVTAAVDQAAQHVPAQVVRAEGVLHAGRDHGPAGVLVVIAEGGELLREDGDQDKEDQHRQAHHGVVVLAEAPPDFGEHAVLFHTEDFAPFFGRWKTLALSYMVFMRGSIYV